MDFIMDGLATGRMAHLLRCVLTRVPGAGGGLESWLRARAPNARPADWAVWSAKAMRSTTVQSSVGGECWAGPKTAPST